MSAVREFGARPFEEVTVGELASAANVTTGAIYHHFGSKLGLYAFVRSDVERRLLDRMEGAAAAAGSTADPVAAVTAALLVGFDFAVQQRFLHLLDNPPAGTDGDRLAEMLASLVDPGPPPLGRLLAAAWRAALTAVADGVPPEQARNALLAFEVRIRKH